MSKIKAVFNKKKVFISFITAGDPSLEKTKEYLLKLQEGGSDIIEIGIPFSDPVAEGAVIQEASIRGLASGTTTDKIFAMLEGMKGQLHVPILLMTYLNPVFHYGYEAFFEKARKAGICGIIIPDLPFEEKKEVQGVANSFAVEVISMIAPTSKERIHKIAKDSQGFIYLVSSLGVTGVRSEIKTDINSMITQIKEVTDTPVAVGFGISTPKQVTEIGKVSDGVIVGSAIVKIIADKGENAGENITEYIRRMKESLPDLTNSLNR
ncbi:MAG TPA: tryptophan synthase subunit alpha [Candidatus Dorea intestinavium]|nr:tryptophan synthase subunit alpha [Candidatus Dorea intestinavium]